MASDELRLVSQRFGSARELSDRQSEKRRWFSYKSSCSVHLQAQAADQA
jgi:hypothetical protein